MQTAAAVTNGCPACRDDVHAQRYILTYKCIYLCAADRVAWDAADEREREREGRRASA